MHRSRLGGLIIDCQTRDLDRDAEFWSRALGCEVVRSEDPAEAGYIALRGAAAGLHAELQRVDHPSRVHLDIASDDVEAEVVRLEKLGARRVESVRDWWILEAPSGHRFCVVPAESPDFEQGANRWD